MPGRKVPLITDQIYHVLNRGISDQLTFITRRDFSRAFEILRYYQNIKVPSRYSIFLTLASDRRKEILENLAREKQFLVEIIAYCFMPNHFHFLLKQLEENGISRFMRYWTDSYTRYFNVKHKRAGPIFQGRFKAVRVESGDQLAHLSRYIHLNPFSSFVVKSLPELEVYPYSSFLEFLDRTQFLVCAKEIVLSQFKSAESYKNFVFDQANYQRKLEQVKHLVLEP